MGKNHVTPGDLYTLETMVNTAVSKLETVGSTLEDVSVNITNMLANLERICMYLTGYSATEETAGAHEEYFSADDSIHQVTMSSRTELDYIHDITENCLKQATILRPDYTPEIPDTSYTTNRKYAVVYVAHKVCDMSGYAIVEIWNGDSKSIKDTKVQVVNLIETGKVACPVDRVKRMEGEIIGMCVAEGETIYMECKLYNTYAEAVDATQAYINDVMGATLKVLMDYHLQLD